ncbi:MAG: hypothetical protein V3S17_05025, partial [candidate division Zixibacteria bacterium]
FGSERCANTELVSSMANDNTRTNLSGLNIFNPFLYQIRNESRSFYTTIILAIVLTNRDYHP